MYVYIYIRIFGLSFDDLLVVSRTSIHMYISIYLYIYICMYVLNRCYHAITAGSRYIPYTTLG